MALGATVSKRRSRQRQQYLEAIAMSSAELGAVIKMPTELIARHVGNALAHDVQAKKERDEAQRQFTANLAYYYEVKQRLLNPGYRTDVDGGKDRTPDENQKNFGAPDWATFNKNCAAYSLQHADRKLKAFAKANGLLPDENDNIDDVEQDDDVPAGPEPRRNYDPTPQKRYEFIATAAMDIAIRNPEGEVEKQILAAAEHKPAPLMPVPPDVFTEVLSFITKISSVVTNEDVRSEAKRLIGKMLLHRPVPDAPKILSEAMEEEVRKRNKRLVSSNGQALGSENFNPPPPTCEHVQRFATEAQADCTAPYEPAPASESEAVEPDPVMSAVKVTICPPAYDCEDEGSCERILPDATGYKPAAVTRLGYVLNEDGKWEYGGKDDAVA